MKPRAIPVYTALFGCEHRERQDLTKASEMEANRISNCAFSALVLEPK